MPPVVLVAPAAFKGTLGPRQVAEAIAAGVRRALPGASVLECPVADGGNGLLDVVLPAGALRERLSVTGPIGEPVSAELGWIDGETAIIESASACGLALVEPEDRDPLRTTTRGVGELIWTAVDRGAKSVVVGLGGTATVDGGTGAARGLGWTFEDAEGKPLPEGGGSLAELAAFASGWGLAARVVALADVATPLLGPEGAAPVFGPQKGARPEEIPRLADGLTRLAQNGFLSGPVSTRRWPRRTSSSPRRGFSTGRRSLERRRERWCGVRKRPRRRWQWSRAGWKGWWGCIPLLATAPDGCSTAERLRRWRNRSRARPSTFNFRLPYVARPRNCR